MKFLLVGNPNVGKSVIFSHLSGVTVIASNYPGTTVELTRSSFRWQNQLVDLIDLPGTYALEPTSPAEEVTASMIAEGDVIINVIDSTNLERSLNLTLQLIKTGKPLLIVLNLWDEANHLGIGIDAPGLERIIGVPVVSTCAITGEGIKGLVDHLSEARAGQYRFDDNERWHEVGKIVAAVQTIVHRHHTWLERLGDASLSPFTGVAIALAVMAGSFGLIRFIGEGLSNHVLEILFHRYWTPVVLKIYNWLGTGFISEILVGRVQTVQINYLGAFGLLTTGLFVPIALVLPYVLAFYLVLGLLEDTGYLPRLAVLADTFTHRLGLHGLAIIPMMLGLGCNVPGLMATRILESKKQRFIAATLTCIAVPCMSQMAVIAGLIGRYGISSLGVVVLTLMLTGMILGIILNRLVAGESPEIFIEIPPYRLPYLRVIAKKLWIRMKKFMLEAEPMVLLGVLIINILTYFHILNIFAQIFSPVVTGWLGLPAQSALALIVGFLRKDVAVGMLVPMGLSQHQLIVASVVLAMYFPCVATFVVLWKELGTSGLIKSTLLMIAVSTLVGGLLNLLL